MKRSEVKDFIPLLQAWADGKTIQVSFNGWWEDIREPCEFLYFNRSVHEYRIKPEPREWYQIVRFPDFAQAQFSSRQEAEVSLRRTHPHINPQSNDYTIIKVREVTE